MTPSVPAAPAPSNPAKPSAESLYSLGLQWHQEELEMLEAAEMMHSEDPDEAAAGLGDLEALLAVNETTKVLAYEKADRVLIVAERLIQQAAFREAIFKRLKDLVAADRKRAESLTGYVIKVLTFAEPNKPRFDLPTHALTSRKSEAVEIEEDVEKEPEKFLGEEFVRTKYEVDKTALKTQLKANEAALTAALAADPEGIKKALKEGLPIEGYVPLPGVKLARKLNWKVQ